MEGHVQMWSLWFPLTLGSPSDEATSLQADRYDDPSELFDGVGPC